METSLQNQLTRFHYSPSDLNNGHPVSCYIRFTKLLALSNLLNKFLWKLIGSVINFLCLYSIQWFKHPCGYVMKHRISLTVEAEQEQWLAMFAWIFFPPKLEFLPSFATQKIIHLCLLYPNKHLLWKTSRLEDWINKYNPRRYNAGYCHVYRLWFSSEKQKISPSKVCCLQAPGLLS